MNPPDYRPAACCQHCYFYLLGSRCSRYGQKVDMLNVCAAFATAGDIEGKEDES